MATDHHHLNADDPLRNPAVDYERADLSARGILLFLAGLLVCCIFIEIVIWGMFRFLRNSEGIFAQSQASPMAPAQKNLPETLVGSKMQNTPPDNVAKFPEPRLQTRDWVDMNGFLASEDKILNPPQPFADSTGAIHIPISDAMKLIEQRLPVRPSAAPAEVSSPTDESTPSVSNVENSKQQKPAAKVQEKR